MITTIKSFKAINDLLIAKFPNVKIHHQDLKTVITRPCFYINLINTKEQKVSSDFSQHTDSFDLIYFATERYEGFLELLQVKEQLNTLLKSSIKIDEDFIPITDAEFNINKDDYILNTLFSISTIQRDEETDVFNPNEDLITELYTDINKEIEDFIE